VLAPFGSLLLQFLLRFIFLQLLILIQKDAASKGRRRRKRDELHPLMCRGHSSEDFREELKGSSEYKEEGESSSSLLQLCSPFCTYVE
jgi:hypothetical protein